MGRKFELGRPAANTKLAPHRVRVVRTRGGNRKFRALRIDQGNFAWGSEAQARKTRIVDVVYNASNNELVRTKTLVKNCIVLIDATPFKLWYKNHYGITLGIKGQAMGVVDTEAKNSSKVKAKHKARCDNERKLDARLAEQFVSGRILACISSRPGQSGRCDGYILEAAELEFYWKKIK